MRQVGDSIDPATTLTLESFGLIFHVRVSDPPVLSMLGPYLPPGAVTRPGNTRKQGRIFSIMMDATGATVYVGSWKGSPPVRLETALRLLESYVEVYITRNARSYAFVHAGAVSWNGRGIILPGRSMAGKSTLVSELVRAGARFYSDEYAVLDADGLLHGYPRPLHLRQDGGYKLPRREAESAGNPVGTDPVPVLLVVLTSYEPGARWEPVELSAGESVLELLPHTITMRRRPAAVLDIFGKLVRSARFVKGPRGEASVVAGDIVCAAGDMSRASPGHIHGLQENAKSSRTVRRSPAAPRARGPARRPAQS